MEMMEEALYPQFTSWEAGVTPSISPPWVVLGAVRSAGRRGQGTAGAVVRAGPPCLLPPHPVGTGAGKCADGGRVWSETDRQT